MAENLAKKPKKGILKSSTSIDNDSQHRSKPKETQWDEMNIIATLHPPDKDYGHMKIEEPKTPYHLETAEGETPDETDCLDAEMLARKIQLEAGQLPKVLQESSSEEEEEETPEKKAKRKSFESKRKQHYNEFQAVKMARKLMENDDEDEDEDDGENSKSGTSDTDESCNRRSNGDDQDAGPSGVGKRKATDRGEKR